MCHKSHTRELRPGARAHAHLVVVELTEDALDQGSAAAHVARMDGGVLPQEEGQKVHGAPRLR